MLHNTITNKLLLVASLLAIPHRSIYNELDITPPQNPKNRKEGIAKKLELREEGWSGYSGLKLGEALESDLIKASEPVDEVELPVNPGVLPVTKNPEAPQTAVWTASKLDQQGKVTGRAVSWAREMREERILSEKGKGDGTFELLGVKVRAANQLWVSAWILWFALFVGQGEESWSEYTGASLGPLIALGLKGEAKQGAKRHASFIILPVKNARRCAPRPRTYRLPT